MKRNSSTTATTGRVHWLLVLVWVLIAVTCFQVYNVYRTEGKKNTLLRHGEPNDRPTQKKRAKSRIKSTNETGVHEKNTDEEDEDRNSNSQTDDKELASNEDSPDDDNEDSEENESEAQDEELETPDLETEVETELETELETEIVTVKAVEEDLENTFQKRKEMKDFYNLFALHNNDKTESSLDLDKKKLDTKKGRGRRGPRKKPKRTRKGKSVALQDPKISAFWNQFKSKMFRHVETKLNQLKENGEVVTMNKEGRAIIEKTFVNIEKEEHLRRDDPWFVLHIGPPKTATTTIQCGLEQYALRLAKTDGYHYIGGGCGVDGAQYFLPSGEQIVLRMMILQGLAKGYLRNEHMKNFVDRSKTLRKQGRSVVLSSELFGSKLPPRDTAMQRMRHSIIEESGFDEKRVRIVLAYRHFVDWLPSYHYQNHADTGRDQPWLGGKTGEPSRIVPFLEWVNNYLTNWEEHENETREKGTNTKWRNQPNWNNQSDWFGEQSLDAILLNNLPRDRFSIHPSWWLYKYWSSYFPLPHQVQVYDMHSAMNSNRPKDDQVTNFICHMLPDADKTCSKLMSLEDKKNNNSTSTTEERKLSEGVSNDEPDYDDISLHSSVSFLNPKKDRKHSVGNSTGTISVRSSSELHAPILVEALLTSGEIPMFDFSAYGPSFFETDRSVEELSPEGHHGYDKQGLTEIAEQLFDEYKIKAPDERYFDCMSKSLEERLLKASLTFVDLMYKHTDMLKMSAQASELQTENSTHLSEEVLEQHREVRYQQALDEHARLFEKNKAKGKYCDISPTKVFKEIPRLYERLTSLSYKPNFRKFKEMYLPDRELEILPDLGLEGNYDRGKGRTYGWENLTPKEKAAVFHLNLATDRYPDR